MYLFEQIFQEGSQAIVGQLGHGDCSSYKQPRLVSYFEKIAIASIACGEDFTTCITGMNDRWDLLNAT